MLNMENMTNITIKRGKIQKYLRMTIDYFSPGKLKSSMFDYIGKFLHDTPEDISGESATPDAHHCFDIDEDMIKLSQTNTDLFNNFVVQILYVSQQARP